MKYAAFLSTRFDANGSTADNTSQAVARAVRDRLMKVWDEEKDEEQFHIPHGYYLYGPDCDPSFTAEFVTAASLSETFLPVVDARYFASEHCLLEYTVFAAKVKTRFGAGLKAIHDRLNVVTVGINKPEPPSVSSEEYASLRERARELSQRTAVREVLANLGADFANVFTEQQIDQKISEWFEAVSTYNASSRLDKTTALTQRFMNDRLMPLHDRVLDAIRMSQQAEKDREQDRRAAGDVAVLCAFALGFDMFQDGGWGLSLESGLTQSDSVSGLHVVNLLAVRSLNFLKDRKFRFQLQNYGHKLYGLDERLEVENRLHSRTALLVFLQFENINLPDYNALGKEIFDPDDSDFRLTSILEERQPDSVNIGEAVSLELLSRALKHWDDLVLPLSNLSKGGSNIQEWQQQADALYEKVDQRAKVLAERIKDRLLADTNNLEEVLGYSRTQSVSPLVKPDVQKYERLVALRMLLSNRVFVRAANGQFDDLLKLIPEPNQNGDFDFQVSACLLIADYIYQHENTVEGWRAPKWLLDRHRAYCDAIHETLIDGSATTHLAEATAVGWAGLILLLDRWGIVDDATKGLCADAFVEASRRRNAMRQVVSEAINSRRKAKRSGTKTSNQLKTEISNQLASEINLHAQNIHLPNNTVNDGNCAKFQSRLLEKLVLERADSDRALDSPHAHKVNHVGTLDVVPASSKDGDVRLETIGADEGYHRLFLVPFVSRTGLKADTFPQMQRLLGLNDEDLVKNIGDVVIEACLVRAADGSWRPEDYIKRTTRLSREVLDQINFPSGSQQDLLVLRSERRGERRFVLRSVFRTEMYSSKPRLRWVFNQIDETLSLPDIRAELEEAANSDSSREVSDADRGASE